MRYDRLLLSISIPAALAALVTCSRAPEALPKTEAISSSLLLTIASNYQVYLRVDDTARFAPALCASNVTTAPPPVLSRSDDPATHGQKLFYLYARYADDYRAQTTNTPLPGTLTEYMPIAGTENVRQILVKESFLPESPGPSKPAKNTSTPIPQDLFMMIQFPASTPGTDHGWVYAVVTPDHKTVKASGLIENCMKCHDSAPHDYLFGLSK